MFLWASLGGPHIRIRARSAVSDGARNPPVCVLILASYTLSLVLIAGVPPFCMHFGLPLRLRAILQLPVTVFRPSQSLPKFSGFLTRPSPTRSMFHKAVNRSQHAESTKKPLAKELFPSSSPSASQSSITQYQSKSIRPLSNTSVNVQRPLGTTTGSNPRRVGSGGAAGIGIKRTSSGLEKIASIGDGFDDDDIIPPRTAAAQPIVITDNTPLKQKQKHTAPVYFDEDDFESDIDLDIEDLSSKGVVTYPTLPTLEPRSQSTFSTAPRRDSRQSLTDRDSGYGSVPPMQPKIEEKGPQPPTSSIPWSSSPPEHWQARSQRASLAKFAYGAAPAPEAEQRPVKRRNIPWLQNQDHIDLTQDDKEEDRAPQRPTSTFEKPMSRGPNVKAEKVNSTPMRKDGKNSLYAWNTTASAMKEQQKLFRQANKKPVEQPPPPTTAEVDENSLRASMAKKKGVARPFLSDEQQHVLDLVVEKKHSVFFTGSAGTGKSVLLREIIAALKKKHTKESDRVAVTASTGLAACNIGGVTLHSFAGFGLGKDEVPELVKKIRRNAKAKHRWMRTKVLVIDEISMVDGDFFDKLENVSRIIRNNPRPFGGLQLVITGDFFQLPPVPDYGKQAKFAFDAASWNTAIDKTIALHHVFRQKDPEFAAMLNEMREGRLSDRSTQAFRKLNRPINFGDSMEATELFPTRQEVEAANNRRMTNLKGEIRVFEARDGGAITDKNQRDKLLQNCMAPDVIHLKRGAQVMLIKNMDDTLVNGSLGKVVGFMNETTFDSYERDEDAFLSTQVDDNGELISEAPKARPSGLLASTALQFPVVRFVMADGTTRDLLCQRETWKIELPNGEVQASRAQVPLILAWALSIHKAQGQTLERVKVDLGRVFEKGQAYVALSRATNMAGLQVLRFEPGKVMAHEKVRNFYKNLSRFGITKEKKAGKSAGQLTRGGFVEDDEDEALSAYM